MRALLPLECLRQLGGEALAERLLGLSEASVDGVLFGDVAGVLCGWPLRVPTSARVELCAESQLGVPEELDVSVVALPAGTRGLSDLQRDVELIELVEGARVSIASPLDQLRIERARGEHRKVAALAAVLEHRRRWPQGPSARREYTSEQAGAAIEAWLTRNP